MTRRRAATPYPLIAARLFDRPLAVTEARLRTVMWALRDRLSLDVGAFEPGPEDFAPAPAERATGYHLREGVAVVPVQNTLVHKASALEAESGVQSYEALRATLDRAATAPGARAILLDIDSPGGEADGAFDLADRIRAVDGQVPVTALIRDHGCSAAYLLASAARRVLVTQSATAGSIGVILAHVDQTARDEMEGLRVTELFQGAYKADGSPHHSLSDDERARLQGYVDSHYDRLVAAVARHRGLTESAVRDTQSAIYVGSDAVEAGLADGLATLDEAIASARAGGGRRRGVQANRRRKTMTAKPKVRAGEQLAELLNELIDEQAGEDGDRSEVIARLADAAGIEPGTINQILRAEINCPPLERLEGFAEVLGVSVERLTEAGEADGCDYSPDGEGAQAKGGGNSTLQAMRDAGAIVEACNAAKLPSLASRLLKEGVSAAAAKRRIAEASEVRDVCAAFGCAGVADTLVAKGLGKDDARQVLEAVRQRVEGDGETVDTALSAAQAGRGGGGQPAIDVKAIYKRFNAEPAQG